MKFTILTIKPANPAAPTVTELNAGLDLSCDVLASDFTWTAADSDKIAEKALCSTSNANALGASNFSAGFSLWRYFDATTGAPEVAADAPFAAVKAKGTQLWGYLRKTGKASTAVWAASDEIALGMEVVTDNLQAPSDQGGFIKYRVPLEPQQGWPFITVAAGS